MVKKGSALIKLLKEQHVQIMDLFKNLDPLIMGIKVSENLCIMNFADLKKILVEHLTLEDKELYPALLASTNPEVKKLGKDFSKDMLGISKKAVKFLEKYNGLKSSELLGNKNFLKDLGDVKMLIYARIKVEEAILYPTFGFGGKSLSVKS